MLEHSFTTLTISNSNRFNDVVNEHLAIADFSGSRGSYESGNHLLEATGRNHDLQLQLRQQIYRVLLAAIDLRMALLTPVAANFNDRDPLHPNIMKGLLNFVEFERLYDRFYFFHDSFRNTDLKSNEIGASYRAPGGGCR